MTRDVALLFLPLLFASSVARAQQVRIGAAEPFATGTVLGRVCEDRDGDGRCADDEPGLAKVRVVLDDGTFAVTDADGRYHIVGVRTRRQSLEIAGRQPRVREDLGRRRVKLDPSTLGPGARFPETDPVVELGPGAMQVLDFPIRFEQPPRRGLEPIPSRAPRIDVHGQGFLFVVTGRAAPGSLIEIDGKAAESTDGEFRAPVALRAGPNRVAISELAPDGTLRLIEQRIDVVPRAEGDVLFVPRPFESRAILRLPRVDGPVQAGSVIVAVKAPAGTRVAIGDSTAEIGTEPARIPIELRFGSNPVKVRVALPDGLTFERTVEIEARAAFFGAGLLGAQLSYEARTRELSLVGSGAGFVETTLGATEILAGVNLDLGDGLALIGTETGGRDALVLLRPREPYAIERALDPESVPSATGDDGLSGALNPAGARLYGRVRHPEYGTLQLGSFHASLAGADYGQFHRSLFGVSGKGRLPLGPVRLKADAFASPPSVPGVEGQPVPAHDELEGTGGSLFYLRHGAVVPGSEKLRIELRDPITQLPLDEQILVRDVDYQIDYRSGRVLLARPLPMAAGSGPFLAQTPLDNHRPTLVVDYEHLPTGGGRGQTAGGRIGLESGWGGIAITGVQERRFGISDADYRLAATHGTLRLGPFSLVGSVAQSRGELFDEALTGGFGISDTGGLSWGTTRFAESSGRPSTAGSLRASWSQERFGGQLWFLAQEAGFNDSAHGTLARARQAGGRARAQFGRVELTAFADDRVGADPRAPLDAGTIGARDAYLRARVPIDRLTLTAEGRFAQLDAPVQVGGEVESGGRAGLALRADYRLVRELSINAAHHQKLIDFGGGLGARDDTFTSAGVVYTPRDDLGLSLRAGWGPVVGTQVQAGAERSDGDEVAYGSYTVDVDGPDAGRTVAVSGARKRVDEEAAVFAEELFARELDGLRAGRAVGLQFEPMRNLGLVARYERGLRMPLFGVPGLLRDAGAITASWIARGLRLSAHGELRREQGTALFESSPSDRWQSLATFAAEARPLRWLGLTGRLNLSRTTDGEVTEAQFVEGLAGVAVRHAPFAVLLQYSITDVLSNDAPLRERRRTQLVLLQPSAEIGSRARIGAGAWLMRQQAAGTAGNVVAASLRPSVRIVENLWTAVELARRSAAPDGESLNAVRAELSYWFGGTVGVGLGYNFHGFSGFGVDEAARNDRVYLRMEAAW